MEISEARTGLIRAAQLFATAPTGTTLVSACETLSAWQEGLESWRSLRQETRKLLHTATHLGMDFGFWILDGGGLLDL